MASKRYLVTGGCGFIGSHLADALLKSGHSVRILDDLSTGRLANKPFGAQLVRADVTNAAAVSRAMADVDGCFHLAAIASVERSATDWVETHRVNVTGAVTVFDAARGRERRGPVPVVYASSAAVYATSNGGTRLAEEAELRPISAYGVDKLGCELHGRIARDVHRVPTVGLRFFNVYGSRQDPNSPYSGVISIFCRRFPRGEPVTVFGDGRQVRDFVHVSDVVAALVLSMTKMPETPVLNVCTGKATSILHLAKTVRDQCGGTGQVVHAAPRPGDIRMSIGDPSTARSVLGFVARTDLCAGLRTILAEARAAEPAPVAAELKPRRELSQRVRG